MLPKSVVLKSALIGAVLGMLQSAAALASDTVNPAESSIVAVAPEEEGSENGALNQIELAKNDVADGVKDDLDEDLDNDDDDDAQHEGADVMNADDSAADAIHEQQELAHNEGGRIDN